MDLVSVTTIILDDRRDHDNLRQTLFDEVILLSMFIVLYTSIEQTNFSIFVLRPSGRRSKGTL